MMPCTSIAPPEVPGAQIVSFKSARLQNVTALTNSESSSAITPTTVDVCDVNITLTHPGDNDLVHLEIWLPFDHASWNGRFQGIGGGGYITGSGPASTSLGPAVTAGYSAAYTDGGHNSTTGADPSTWALEDGKIVWPLLVDFSSRSLHDLAVVGKAVSANYYGTPSKYSYWNGCSTGGRQGLMEAQKFAGDYDGILANAPAINWASFLVAEFWPQVAMQTANVFPTQCEFQAFQNASIELCDGLDGAVDGIISNPFDCTFDPQSLIGKQINCNGSVTITKPVADLVEKIFAGPQSPSGKFLWYGILPGTSFSGLANTTTINGKTIGVPFSISATWIQDFLMLNPSYNVSAITFESFTDLFYQSLQDYNSIIGTTNPDLAPFQKSGGKMITWHGLSDQLIFPNGTINYLENVQALMGGPDIVNEFYRVFLVPGAQHCASYYGPAPVPAQTLEALVKWVEEGIAPETLFANDTIVDGSVVSRNICLYPKQPRYQGGDMSAADSFTCE